MLFYQRIEGCAQRLFTDGVTLAFSNFLTCKQKNIKIISIGTKDQFPIVRCLFQNPLRIEQMYSIRISEFIFNLFQFGLSITVTYSDFRVHFELISILISKLKFSNRERSSYVKRNLVLVRISKYNFSKHALRFHVKLVQFGHYIRISEFIWNYFQFRFQKRSFQIGSVWTL